MEESIYKNGLKHGECIKWIKEGGIRTAMTSNYVEGVSEEEVGEEEY